MAQSIGRAPIQKTSRAKEKVPFFIRIFSKGNFDTMFFVLVMILLSVGTIMMFSASYVNAQYHASSNYDAFHYLKRQLMVAIPGVFIMLIIANFNYKFYYKKWFIIFAGALSVGLLLYVLVNPYILENKENIKRWIWIPGLNQQFQPSELAKIGLILLCAAGFHKKERLVRWMKSKDVMPRLHRFNWVNDVPYIALVAVFTVLVFMENHLSGTILMFAIGLAMIFIGGNIKSKYYIIAALVLLVVGVFVIAERHTILANILDDRIIRRIDSFLDPSSGSTGDNWQTNQSLYAVGSGGLFGTGIGNSKQKHLYLPEPQNDFIFAIVCEELGFFRAALILLIFALLVWRGFVIAMKCPNRFGKMLALGIVFQVGLQTALNVCVVTAMIPNTGISLPFFSYGGSSLLILLCSMGVVLSVSRKNQEKYN